MTTYKGIRGQTIRTIAGDASPLIAGDIWYSSTTRKIRGAKSGLGTGSWSSGGNTTSVHTSLAGAGSSLSAYMIFGGYTAGVGPPTSRDITETYDGSSWTEVGDMNQVAEIPGGCGTTAAAIKIGGNQAPGLLATVEKWNGTSWTEVGDLNTARLGCIGAGTNTACLSISGGGSPPKFAQVEQWDGSSWTEIADVNAQRDYAAASGSTTAAIFFGGNNAPPGITANSETWNGTSWTEGANLTSARKSLGGSSQGPSTLTLAIGGADGSSPDHTGKTEEWDGSSWTEAADLSTARLAEGASGVQSSACIAGGANPSPTGGQVTEEWEKGVAASSFTSS